MAIKVNSAATRKARAMIAANQYVLDSTWGKDNPDAEAENDYLDRHGWDEYAAWHLGVDDDAEAESKERYSFPFGDFRRVHRSGLVAAKQRAAQFDHREVGAAADRLLAFLDKTSGA